MSTDPPSLAQLSLSTIQNETGPSEPSPAGEVLAATAAAMMTTTTGSNEPSTAQQQQQNRRIGYRRYKGEDDIPIIMRLVDSELSEPYNWYTYRYFLQDWPNLCFFAYDKDSKQDIGTVLCKQDVHRDKLNRGYLAMLSVHKPYRAAGVATRLVRLAITEMVSQGAQEVVLETEFDNFQALKFYSKLGFVKDKRLYRFYLNAKDAFRLKLKLESGEVRLFDGSKEEAKEMVERALKESQEESD
ncbi:hypothetical protein ACM66B_003912 [Microbotryomycetes sp. NB124-2]